MIGHYRVLDLLGEGGMGSVYRALDERLGREVALKLLKNRDDANSVERFFREARAASALNHPNIVTVFDAGEAEQGHYIVMELIRGRVLRSLIDQPCKPRQFLSVGRQSAEALAVAHAAGIVHRDIKPENIMIRDDGYVKVLDFGLARLSGSAALGADVETGFATSVHTIVGTKRYMSPEQATGKPVDTAADLFSLGVVFYELATGRHPFAADSQYGVLLGILSRQPIPPSRFNSELPAGLEALILGMLDKEPSRRPTAAATVSALADLVVPAGAPVHHGSVAKRESVGRAKIRGELNAAFDHVRRERGLMICVSGEPGIGKSTLVDDFLADVAETTNSACHVARGRCSERLEGTEAYLPLLDALEDLLRTDDGGLTSMMKAVAPLWYGLVAPTPQGEPGERIITQPRTGGQERLKRELMAFLIEACRTRPMILFFDDMQWVDISTTDMLAYVTRHFASLPLFIAVAYRPEELLVQKHPFLAMKRDLQGRGLCREVALQFLTRDEIAQYIGLKFPHHQFPQSFVDLIHVKTEGNPLFVVDVLRYLVDRGVLSEGDGTWPLTRTIPDIATELPESVRGIIQGKIDILSDSDRRLLVAASVQGYEFDAAVVARVFGIDASEAEDELDTLDRVHGFVRRVREQEFPDGTLTLRYRFVHVLYQNMLYASLTPARKQSTSRAVGKALEQFYGERAADIALELAILYETARDFSRAADYFSAAAENAAGVFAYEEAFVLSRRALSALGTLADDTERRRRELPILITAGVAARAIRGFSSPEVRELSDRASALCVEFDEARQFARVLWGLVASNVVSLRLDSAQEATDRLADLARDSRDPVVMVHEIIGTGLVRYHRGEFEMAAKDFGRATAACTMDMRRSVCADFGYDPAAPIYLSWCLWFLGFPNRAVRAMDDALQQSHELGHRYSLAMAMTFASAVDCWRGDWDRLKRDNDRALAISKEEGYSYFIATCTFLEGLWQSRQGERKKGLVQMREGLDSLRTMHGCSSLRRFTTEYAQEAALDGQLDEALDLVAAETKAMNTDRFWAAELRRVTGELLSRRGGRADVSRAERCFEEAIAVAQAQQAKSLELRATISLARLWHSMGKSRDAALRLSEIYGWFTEGFDSADLQEARTLLWATRAIIA
jgi:tetratricopeptide (TPR) repeat protein